MIESCADVVITLRRDDGVAFARVECDVDMASAPAIERYVEESLDGATGLVIALGDAPHFDSNGIRVLVRLARRLGDRFAIVAPRGTAARRVLDLTADLTRLRVRQTEADAFALVRADSINARTRG